jgi:putative addiction module component (TIGR02574 family)
MKGDVMKRPDLSLSELSLSEKLDLMEALWDSLTDEESKVQSPEWHRDILEERKRKFEEGEAEFISLEKFRASRKL